MCKKEQRDYREWNSIGSPPLRVARPSRIIQTHTCFPSSHGYNQRRDIMSNSTPRAGPSRPSAPRRTSTLKDSSAASSPVTSPVPTPTRKQSAVSSVAERKARREQLRNFYGIRDDASSGTASPGKGVKAAGRKAKKAPKDGERDPSEGNRLDAQRAIAHDQMRVALTPRRITRSSLAELH